MVVVVVVLVVVVMVVVVVVVVVVVLLVVVTPLPFIHTARRVGLQHSLVLDEADKKQPPPP